MIATVPSAKRRCATSENHRRLPNSCSSARLCTISSARQNRWTASRRLSERSKAVHHENARHRRRGSCPIRGNIGSFTHSSVKIVYGWAVLLALFAVRPAKVSQLKHMPLCEVCRARDPRPFCKVGRPLGIQSVARSGDLGVKPLTA